MSTHDWIKFLSQDEIERAKRRAEVVRLRDIEKMTWPAIGFQLKVTKDCASDLYKKAKWRLLKNEE